MNGSDHRRRHQARESQRDEIRLIVNQIELAGAFENMRGVQQLPDLRIDRWIFGIRPRANGGEGARSLRIGGRKQGDVHAARHKCLGQQAGDELPGAIMARRGAPRNRARPVGRLAGCAAMRVLSKDSLA